MKKILLFIIVLLVISGCSSEQIVEVPNEITSPEVPKPIPVEEAAAQTLESKDIFIRTKDEVLLSGTLYLSGKDDAPSLILLHMLGRDKSTYVPLIEKLRFNYNIITIDFRGHGKSELNYEDFSDEDWQSLVKDVVAVKKYLVDNKFNTYQLGLVGASIGANVALNYAVGDRDVSTIVLLSPGINYKNIETEFPSMAYERSMLLVASSEDTYSSDTINTLEKKTTATIKEKVEYKGAGHGTAMFTARPELIDKIDDWIRKTI